jgi:hypothetical protein
MLLRSFYRGLNQKASEHLDLLKDHSCNSLRDKPIHLCRRYIKIKAGPRRTLNTIIRVKKYKKMKSWKNY